MALTFKSPTWIFQVMVSNAPALHTSYGYITPMKIVLKDRGNGNVRIEVSGPSRNGGGQHRTGVFGLSKTAQFEQAPDWVLQVIREAGFGRTEV